MLKAAPNTNHRNALRPFSCATKLENAPKEAMLRRIIPSSSSIT